MGRLALAFALLLWGSVGIAQTTAALFAGRRHETKPVSPDVGVIKSQDGAGALATHCTECHGGKAAEGGFTWVTDAPRLVSTGFIVPGNAEASPLYQRVAGGEMPPEHAPTRPTRQEIAALRTWINDLSLTVELVSGAAIDAALRADWQALGSNDREHARWLTLAHLANAGTPEPQLDRHRQAIARLLASLSWSPELPSLVAVDERRTLLRIDLRQLGWTKATWDALLSAYPYETAQTDGPLAVRADWLVATASKPPLYYSILGIPETEAELGRKLGIDVHKNIAEGRVARAGFVRSGIALHNRVIERHATRGGAYWRSYEFASSVGRENVFCHPTDFNEAGGEGIMTLPNGMHAYVLFDRSGRRVDEAPLHLVSNVSRPDRTLKAGGCFTCHTEGIIPRTDQVRAVIESELEDGSAATPVERAERARALRLYPKREAFAALQAEDGARYRAALTRLGTPADATGDAITELAMRYEAGLDVRLAAAELGVTSDELRSRLSSARDVRRELGILLQPGGTAERGLWESSFSRLVVPPPGQ